MNLIERKPELAKKLTQILKNKNSYLRDHGFTSVIQFEIDKFPLNLKTLYPEYPKFVLEIGSGWGEFTNKYASLHSDSLIIALEKKKYRIKKSAKDQAREKNNNIRWMVLDLDWYFTGLFAKHSFDKIIINFPDPWPKKRHHKHRFIRKELIEEIYNICKHGATIEYATDFWPYMEAAAKLFEKNGNWKNNDGKFIISRKIPNRPVSFFESTKKEEGENTYFLTLTKV